MKRIAFGLLALCLIALPQGAWAVSTQTGEDIVIPAAQPLQDDLYAVGTNITIDGTLEGDLVVFGSTVTINGVVNGNVWAMAETVNVKGTVTGSVRAAAGTVEISGNVKRDAVVAASTFRLTKTGIIGRDVKLAAATANFDGAVVRNVSVQAQRPEINGAIGGTARVSSAEGTKLGSTANIAGNLTVISSNSINRDPGAVVQGTFSEEKPQKSYSGHLLSQWYWFLASLILLLGMLAYARRAVLRGRDILLERPLLAPLLGIGFVLLVPLVALLMIAILVGIPVALVTLGLYVLVLYTAKIFVSILIGSVLLRLPNAHDAAFWKVALAGILGLAFYYLLTAVPFIGTPLVVLIMLWGVGAQLLLAKEVYASLRAKYGA